VYSISSEIPGSEGVIMIPHDLIKKRETKNAVFFCGAGISRGVKTSADSQEVGIWPGIWLRSCWSAL
jgi:hypothetical protein